MKYYREQILGPVADLGLPEGGPSLNGDLELSVEQLQKLQQKNLPRRQKIAIRRRLQEVLTWRAELEEHDQEDAEDIESCDVEEDTSNHDSSRIIGPLQHCKPLRIHRDDRMCDLEDLKDYTQSAKAAPGEVDSMQRYLQEVNIWEHAKKNFRYMQLRNKAHDRQ